MGLLLCSAGLPACQGEHDARADAQAEPSEAGVSDESDAQHSDGFATPANLPDGWRRVASECSISLRGPDLVATPSTSSDHCLATFADSDCTYQVEYGELMDAFELASGSDYEREDVLVDGEAAQLITLTSRLNSDAYLAGLRIASFRQDPPEYSLTASARCASREGQESARLVLQTVDLPHVGEGLCAPIRPQKCSPI